MDQNHQMEIATAVLAIALFIACAIILFLVLKKPSNEPKGFTSRSVSRSGNDNSSSSLPVTSRNEGETLQSSNLKSFGYKELIASTGNFHPDCLLSEGGFGPVFKGWIDEHSLAAMKPGTGIAVVVMRLLLERVGFLGEREWLDKINKLGQLQHPNLVKLIGYCVEDEHRLLVYEFMPTGSLEDHLFKRGSYLQPLSWSLRMKISLGAAKGLAFLHSTEPEAMYNDFNTYHILLDYNYNAKLSDFGLARKKSKFSSCQHVVPESGLHVAPEYIMGGVFTHKSNVYSFGLVLLEIITGRPASNYKRPSGEMQYLVQWVKPYLSNKRSVFRVMDPHLVGQCSYSRVYATAALAMQCLAWQHRCRPTMDEVVTALEQLQEPLEKQERC